MPFDATAVVLTALPALLAGGWAARAWGMRRLKREIGNMQARMDEACAESERVRERCRENENRLRTIIESEPECVKLTDPQGIVLEINPAGLAIVDASCNEDFIGQSIFRFIAPEYHDAYRTMMNRALAGEKARQEYRAVSLKGQERWMESHAAPLRDARGEIAAILSITRDTTERRRAEEKARLHLTQLAHVSRLNTMGEMASAIAHELNQPLAAIANYAGGALRRMRGNAPPSPEELRQALESLTEQAERAGSVLREIRRFVSKAPPVTSRINLNELVRTTAGIAEPEIRQNGIALRFNLADPAPEVQADRIEIEQVVLNLVHNAVGAMSDPGVAERVLTISTARNTGEAVELSVSDSGPGVPPDIASQVFEPFFSTKADGMGFGLTISRSIAEAHGGRLWLADRAPPGATFTLALPAHA